MLKIRLWSYSASTPDFSNQDFSTMNLLNHGVKKFMVEMYGVVKSWVEMSFKLLEGWHFNPRLLNQKYFKFMVEKSWVEKFTIEKSGVKAWSIKVLGRDVLQPCKQHWWQPYSIHCFPCPWFFHVQMFKTVRQLTWSSNCSFIFLIVRIHNHEFVKRNMQPVIN